jgi:hypothetical protein
VLASPNALSARPIFSLSRISTTIPWQTFQWCHHSRNKMATNPFQTNANLGSLIIRSETLKRWLWYREYASSQIMQ